MANEITFSGLLQYANPAYNIPTLSLSSGNIVLSITGKYYYRGTQSIPTTAGGTALNLGSVSTPGGWLIIFNRDPTNYVQLMTAVSTGAVFARINPTEAALLRLDATVTAPAAIAHTAACIVEYLVLDS